MGSARRRYSPEFKQEAVRLVAEGLKVSQVASDLGIRPEMLRRWKHQVEAGGSRAFPGHGRVRPENAELAALRRENKRLREERDILKKATAFFAAYERRGSR
jgi:transposase